jgi:hypothetical protein
MFYQVFWVEKVDRDFGVFGCIEPMLRQLLALEAVFAALT